MKLQITLKKSPISSLQVHKDTVAALGLHKVGQTVVKEDNACIRGHDLPREAHDRRSRNQGLRRESQ